MYSYPSNSTVMIYGLSTFLMFLDGLQPLSHSRYVALDPNPNPKTKIIKLVPPFDQPIRFHAGCDSPRNENLKRLSAGCDCPCEENKKQLESVKCPEEDQIQQKPSAATNCCGCKKSSKKKKEPKEKKKSPKQPPKEEEPVKKICKETTETYETKAKSGQKSKKSPKKYKNVDIVVSADSSLNNHKQRTCCPIFGRRRPNKKKREDGKKNNKSMKKDKSKTPTQDEAARIAYLEQQICTMRLELSQIRREIMPAECTRYAILSERLQQLNEMLTEIKNDEEQSTSEFSCDTDDTLYSRTEEEEASQYYSQHDMETAASDCNQRKKREQSPVRGSGQKLKSECSGVFERWEKKQADQKRTNEPMLVIDSRKQIDQWEANERRRLGKNRREPEWPEARRKSEAEQRLETRRKSDDAERRRRQSEQRDDDERQVVAERKADLDRKQEVARRKWHEQKNGTVMKQEPERLETDLKNECNEKQPVHHCDPDPKNCKQKEPCKCPHCNQIEAETEVKQPEKQCEDEPPQHVEKSGPCKCPHCEKMAAEAGRKQPVQHYEAERQHVEHKAPCKCPHCEKREAEAKRLEAGGKLEKQPFTCMHDTSPSWNPTAGQKGFTGKDETATKREPNRSTAGTPTKSCLSGKRADTKTMNEPNTAKGGKPKTIKERKDPNTTDKMQRKPKEPACKGKVISSPSYTSEPAVLYSRKEELGKSDFSDSSSSCCIHCANKEVPTVTENLCGEIQKIIKRRNPSDVVLTVLLRADFMYHVNVAVMKNSEWLGCLYATEEAIDEANTQNLFQNFLTFFIVDANNTLEQKTKIMSHTFEFVRSK